VIGSGSTISIDFGTWIHAGRQNQPQKEETNKKHKVLRAGCSPERLRFYFGAWKPFLEA
jgi:hypothetical protein